MDLTRRTMIAGAAAAVAGPARARTAARRFTILRGGDDVGRHEIALTREGDTLNVAIDVEIVVRVLGIAAYRYEMTNREVWRSGLLQSVDCSVNDDGERKRVNAARNGEKIVVDASFYSGPAPSEIATTTYFTPDFLTRPRWMSTDSGELYAMSISRDGEASVRTASGEAQCARWRASNGSDFDVQLFYDANGEWASVAFDGRGEPIIYVPDSLDGRLAALWAETA
ncbi:DUF6134 family protein [Rubrimonas cliftonensis]|uniref:DUF3108 domain-containing protein n=1 Tax=Rubrimonas cliftonensis TaxID=89524 RepID=A0A1H3W8N5_9RHOB|nr:DUF6134 family protein [Rubrimonas cliftonensis]SDZ82702.1 hypothetical protein SAMN05444370_101546 [Rubrimonas cliftonensis]